MRRFNIKKDEQVYHVQKLMDGVGLFKIEVNDCIYEIFKPPAGEWKLLYCSPNCPDISVDMLGRLVDAALPDQEFLV